MKKLRKKTMVTSIANPDDKPTVDHIDKDKTNNNVQNLRWATRSEQVQNQGKRSDNTSGYKGVCYHKQTKKYQARIRIGDKYKSLGYFKTAEEASKAYEAAAKEHHGIHYYKYKN